MKKNYVNGIREIDYIKLTEIINNTDLGLFAEYEDFGINLLSKENEVSSKTKEFLDYVFDGKKEKYEYEIRLELLECVKAEDYLIEYNTEKHIIN